MGWRLLGKPKTQKVTKSLAKQYTEMDPAPHDRPLSERRLQVYQRLREQGLFRPVTWASALCTETGGVYRVNGKHTSVMLSGLNNMPDDFYVTVEEYECDTLEDVARLYATFDSKTQSRSSHDINASFAATVPELRDISTTNISRIVAGMSFAIEGGKYNSTISPAERAELLLEHTHFVVWCAGILSQGSPGEAGARVAARHLRRAPVIAAMFDTWTKSKTAADEFWCAVRDETGTSPTLPDRKLARLLLTTSLGHERSGSASTHLLPAREVYVKSLHAWNAWRNGESTAMKYYVDKPVPSAK